MENLVENSLKFTRKGGKINIYCKLITNKCGLSNKKMTAKFNEAKCNMLEF